MKVVFGMHSPLLEQSGGGGSQFLEGTGERKKVGMNLRKIIMMVTLLVLLVSILFSSGCGNTWRGAGKDVEKTGKKMQGEE